MKLSKEKLEYGAAKIPLTKEDKEVVRKYHEFAGFGENTEDVLFGIYWQEGADEIYTDLINAEFTRHFARMLLLIDVYRNFDLAMLIELYGEEGIEDCQFNAPDKALSELLTLLKLQSALSLSLTITSKDENGKLLSSIELGSHYSKIIQESLSQAIQHCFDTSKYSGPTLLMQLLSPIDIPTVANIEPLLQEANVPIKGFKVESLFRRLTVLKMRDYLNAETEYKQGDYETLSTKQAKILYALLICRNLITVDTMVKHRNEAARVKYVRSIISTPETNQQNSREKGRVKEFPTFIRVTDPKEIEKYKNGIGY